MDGWSPSTPHGPQYHISVRNIFKPQRGAARVVQRLGVGHAGRPRERLGIRLRKESWFFFCVLDLFQWFFVRAVGWEVCGSDRHCTSTAVLHVCICLSGACTLRCSSIAVWRLCFGALTHLGRCLAPAGVVLRTSSGLLAFRTRRREGRQCVLFRAIRAGGVVQIGAPPFSLCAQSSCRDLCVAANGRVRQLLVGNGNALALDRSESGGEMAALMMLVFEWGLG